MTEDVDPLLSKRILSEAEPAVGDAFISTIQSRVLRERWVGRGVAIAVQVSAGLMVGLFAWLGLRVAAPHWINPPDLPMLSGLTHLIAFGSVLVVTHLVALLSRTVSSPDGLTRP